MWIPGYTKLDLGPDGGVFDEKSHPKGCIHTTQGYTLASAEATYRNYPPHIGYDPIRRIKHQYVPLNKHSYAFRGDENDDEYIIQIEIVGFAEQTHLWSSNLYKNIADDVIVPLEELIGIPRIAPRFYGAGEGIILASARSPVRFDINSFRNFSGWVGHQHVPSPDEHWDPGKFLIHECFNHLSSTVGSTGRKEFDMTVRLQQGNDRTNRDENGVLYGDYVFMVKYDPELEEGAVRVHMEDGPVYRSLLKAQGSVDVVAQRDLDSIPRLDEPENSEDN